MSAMGRQSGSVLALGERSELEGYALAGVDVVSAETDDDVRQHWTTLDSRASVVLLTRRAAAVLGADADDPAAPLVVVLPE